MKKEKMKKANQYCLLVFTFLFILSACSSVTAQPTIAEQTNKVIKTPTEIPAPISTATSTPAMWDVGTYLTFQLNEMTILPEMEIWAVGDPGIVLHDYYRLEIKGLYEEQNGDLDLRTLGSLIAVDFISSDDGWMASSLGGIFHWNGIKWKTIIPANPEAYHALNDIKFADTDNGWAIGCFNSDAQNSSGSSGDTPVMLQWTGAEWVDVSSLNNLGVNDCLYSIDIVSENSVWILGDHYKNGAIVLHWNGLEWQRIPVPKSMHGRNSISASSDTNVWVTADKGNIGSNVYYWNGNVWQQMELPSSPYVSFPRSKRSPEILAVASDNVWAGGNGIFHWDGKEWKDMAYDTRYGYIVDIEKAPDGTIWALTVRGSLLKLNYEQK